MMTSRRAVSIVDGHDENALERELAKRDDRPRAVVAHTVSGKGVSFMEGVFDWHYLPMSPEQEAVALGEQNP